MFLGFRLFFAFLNFTLISFQCIIDCLLVRNNLWQLRPDYTNEVILDFLEYGLGMLGYDTSVVKFFLIACYCLLIPSLLASKLGLLLSVI